jgi:hypothetical protein
MLDKTAGMGLLAEHLEEHYDEKDENGHADQPSEDSHWAHWHECSLKTIVAPVPTMDGSR